MTDDPALRPLTVLCVDDDADILAVIRLSLSLDEGLTLYTAESGTRAASMFGSGLRPDILLVGQRQQGIELAACLRAMAVEPFPPVVFVTAAVRDQDLTIFREAGAAGTIAKPFDPLTLAAQVRSIYETASIDAS